MRPPHGSGEGERDGRRKCSLFFSLIVSVETEKELAIFVESSFARSSSLPATRSKFRFVAFNDSMIPPHESNLSALSPLSNAASAPLITFRRFLSERRLMKGSWADQETGVTS